MVVLTTVVNAAMMEWVITALGMSEPNDAEQQVLCGVLVLPGRMVLGSELVLADRMVEGGVPVLTERMMLCGELVQRHGTAVLRACLVLCGELILTESIECRAGTDISTELVLIEGITVPDVPRSNPVPRGQARLAPRLPPEPPC
eukprot:2001295-Rhodomonas_salina.1